MIYSFGYDVQIAFSKGRVFTLQFIALLLKDMTKVKLLLLIIRLNANMSWMMALCTEIPGGGQVGGRVVVAPCFQHTARTLQHTSPGNYCPNYQPHKTDRGFAHQHCRPLWMHQIFVLPHPCSCSMGISALVRVHHTRGSALPVVQSCAVVVSELFFTSKTSLGLPKLQTSICTLMYKNVLHYLLYSASHPYSGPRGEGFPFLTIACSADGRLDLLLGTMFLLSGQN